MRKDEVEQKMCTDQERKDVPSLEREGTTATRLDEVERSARNVKQGDEVSELG